MKSGIRRMAIVNNNRLIASLFLSPLFDLPSRRWLSQIFANQELTDFQRRALLAGREGDAGSDPGTIICSCFQIGDNQIKAAVAEGINDVEALGQKLKCGTNCGSCIPELKVLVDKYSQQSKHIITKV